MSTTVAASSPPLSGRTLPIFRLWIWFALGFGLLEGWYMFFAHSVFHQATLLGPHVLWMAPVMDVIWFALPAVLLFAATRLWPERFSLRAVSGVFIFLGVFTLCLIFGGLHRNAGLLIAGGFAVQGTRLIASRADRFLALTRRGVWVLLALVALSAAGVNAAFRMAERRALAGGGKAPAGAPNVLLLVLDTVRDWSVSVDGYDRPTTPMLQQFATGGVRFSRAWSPAPWTLASHATMFTGYFPHQLSAGLRTALDGAKPTLAEVFTRRGYATGGFVANLHFCSREFGLNRGFTHYEDFVVSPGELLLNSSLGRYLATHMKVRELLGYYDIIGRRRADGIDRRLLTWLRGTKGRPYFAFVNYYDAHEPYLPPADFERRFASNTPRVLYKTDQSIRGARMLFKQQLSPAQIRRERDAYDASIASLDSEIGQLLDSLRAGGMLDNTLVIITSDHGEQFGERGLFVHGNSLYEPVMSVPLLLAFPSRLPAGVTVDDRINTRDLPATILDLVGDPARDSFPGQSLSRYWTPGQPVPVPTPLFFEVVTTKNEILRSVVQRDTQYVRRQDGREELYALRRNENPPDLVKEAAAQAVLQELRTTMDSILTATGPDKWGR